MAWEKRGEQVYYYHVTRDLDGCVKRHYAGRGDNALELAALMERKAAIALQLRRGRQEAALLLRDSEQAESHQRVMRLARVYLEAHGYHCPGRWKWRKRMSKSKALQVKDEALPIGGSCPTNGEAQQVGAIWSVPQDVKERYAIIDAGVLAGATADQVEKARACLRAHPEGIPAMTRFRPIESLTLDCANDAAILLKEIQVERCALDLAGPNPSPIVLAMAQQVVADLLALNTNRLIYRQTSLSDKGIPIKLVPMFDKPVDIAHRRYLASSKMLAELKRLALPQVNVAMPGSVQMNAGINQLNHAGVGAVQVNG